MPRARAESFAFSVKGSTCLGLEKVKASIAKSVEVSDFSETKQDLPLLVSCYWNEQLYDFAKWRLRSDVFGRRIIVGGQAATTNPAPFVAWGHDVYLGDGEEWGGLNDMRFIVNRSSVSPKPPAVTARMFPDVFIDSQHSGHGFVEISRGCKNKCLFCQYTWLKPYRECALADIVEVTKIAGRECHSMRFFAADRMQHSSFSEIMSATKRLGKRDTSSDVSIKYLLNHREFITRSLKIRTGIEGMSARLRFLVGKKFTDDDLIDLFCDASERGCLCFDLYMIYGLPTETADDIKQFADFLKKLDKRIPNNNVFMFHWNAFTPSAQTPFQWQASAFEYPFIEEFNKQILPIKLTKLRVMHRPALTSNATITKRMLAIRACEKSAPLLSAVAKSPSKISKHYPEINTKYKSMTGRSLHDKWPEDIPLPWDKYVVYNKLAMQKLCNHNMKRYGII